MEQSQILSTPNTNPSYGINLPSIVVSAIICVALQTAFMYLGAAIGLSVFDVGGEAPGAGAPIGAALYTLATLAVSFFVSGFIASRISGSRDKPNAFYHGVGTWAFASLLFIFMLGSSAMSSFTGAMDATSAAASNNRQEIERNVTRGEVQEATEDAKNAAAGTFAFLFVSSVLSLGAAYMGSQAATRNYNSAYRSQTYNRRTAA